MITSFSRPMMLERGAAQGLSNFAQGIAKGLEKKAKERKQKLIASFEFGINTFGSDYLKSPNGQTQYRNIFGEAPPVDAKGKPLKMQETLAQMTARIADKIKKGNPLSKGEESLAVARGLKQSPLEQAQLKQLALRMEQAKKEKEDMRRFRLSLQTGEVYRPITQKGVELKQQKIASDSKTLLAKTGAAGYTGTERPVIPPELQGSLTAIAEMAYRKGQIERAKDENTLASYNQKGGDSKLKQFLDLTCADQPNQKLIADYIYHRSSEGNVDMQYNPALGENWSEKDPTEFTTALGSKGELQYRFNKAIEKNFVDALSGKRGAALFASSKLAAGAVDEYGKSQQMRLNAEEKKTLVWLEGKYQQWKKFKTGGKAAPQAVKVYKSSTLATSKKIKEKAKALLNISPSF